MVNKNWQYIAMYARTAASLAVMGLLHQFDHKQLTQYKVSEGNLYKEHDINSNIKQWNLRKKKII